MIGTVIDHYRVLRQLGAGGMGVVYEAEDTRLGRHVALKFLPESLSVEPEVVERFEREARTLAALSHPNICTIHDIGAHGGRRFIAMELLDGESLRSRIHDQPLPLEQILDAGCQIADALDAAHAKGVVHRDIKPANIFVTRRGQAKLLDFGIAKLGGGHVHDAAAETHVASDVLTSPGMAVGSINYMSPEQARGEETDGRTDLFSLGLVLYEMATGRQAFGGQTTAVVFDAILNRQPTDPRIANPSLPDELHRVIMRSLEKDRRLRFQTAADMLAELNRIRRDTSGHTAAAPAGPAVPAVPGTAPATVATGRPRWLVPAAALVTVALAGGYYFRSGTATPAFTERDTVVVADFVNSTGDAVFDDALRQAVSVQLQQTPFITLLADQQVQRTLRLMQREPDEAVTGAVAREVCQRAGAKATVEGSIASLGSAYVLTIGVHNCQTGETLAQEQVQADAKETVLAAVGTAVTSLRQRLGESLASIAKYDVPVTEATTGSLEALRAYGLALRARFTKGDEASIPFFQQALAIDPDFALAHAKLGVVFSNLSQQGLGARYDSAREHALQAYALRDRVSEYERRYITWLHARLVLEDPQKVKETLELLIASYPRDFAARNNLGIYYMTRAEYEQAIEHFHAASEIAPDEPTAVSNAAFALLFLGRTDEADPFIDRALSMRSDPGLATMRWRAAVVMGDPRADDLLNAAEAALPPDQVPAVRAARALWHGRLRDYARLQEQQRAHLRAARNEAQLHELEVGMALTLGALGDRDQLASVRRMLRTAMPPAALAQVSAVAAALGETDAVRPVLPKLEAGIASLSVRAPFVVARAYVRAADGAFDEAIADLEALYRELPQSADLRLHLGRLRQLAGDLDGAAADYEFGLSRKVLLGPDIPVILARLGLGTVRLEQGRLDEARAQFDALLDQWTDADTEFGLLRDVRELRKKAGTPAP